MRRGDAIIKARHLCGPSAYLVQNGAEYNIFYIEKSAGDLKDFSGTSWDDVLDKAQKALRPEPTDGQTAPEPTEA